MADNFLPPPITAADPNAFEALRASIPRAQRIRHFLALDLADHITHILHERHKSRRWLAQRLGKTDSELSKWLSGTHNLTLDSVAKLSDALEEDLLVSTRFPMGFFGNTQASAPAGATRTSFDQAGGSLARKAKRLSPKGAFVATTPQVPPVPQEYQEAGDYSYAMAA